MKIKRNMISCILLMITLLSACSSTTSDFGGITMGEHHLRNADMGNSVAQVMASEKGNFIEEITADSPEGQEYFAQGVDGTVLKYSDSNVAGHKSQIMYVFLEGELIGGLLVFDALYPKELYSQLIDYYENELPAPSDNRKFSDYLDVADYRYWERDDVISKVLITENNMVLIEVATKKYFDQLF